MHRLSDLDDVLLFQQSVGGYNCGSCFGVRDADQLRPPPQKSDPPQEEQKDTNKKKLPMRAPTLDRPTIIPSPEDLENPRK